MTQRPTVAPVYRIAAPFPGTPISFQRAPRLPLLHELGTGETTGDGPTWLSRDGSQGDARTPPLVVTTECTGARRAPSGPSRARAPPFGQPRLVSPSAKRWERGPGGEGGRGGAVVVGVAEVRVRFPGALGFLGDEPGGRRRGRVPATRRRTAPVARSPTAARSARSACRSGRRTRTGGE